MTDLRYTYNLSRIVRVGYFVEECLWCEEERFFIQYKGKEKRHDITIKSNTVEFGKTIKSETIYYTEYEEGEKHCSLIFFKHKSRFYYIYEEDYNVSEVEPFVRSFMKQGESLLKSFKLALKVHRL